MNDIEALADRVILIGKGSLLFDGNVGDLRTRFGSRKTITADYRHHPHPIDIPGVSLVSWSPERAVLSVDTERTMIADVISRLSGQVELLDVSVEAQPIEEIIVQLYKEYQL